MTIEINIQDYSGPAELATAIRDSIGQLYVDDVRVQCGKAAHRITPNTADAVCRGLLIASALNEPNAPSDRMAGADAGGPRWDGRAEKEREITSLRHTITLLEKEAVGMEMELDCSCNAEELRQARAENASMRELLFRFSCNTAYACDAHRFLANATESSPTKDSQ